MGILLLFPLIYNGSISIQKSLPMGWVFSTGLALQLFHLQLSYLIIELQLLILGRLVQDEGDEARAPPR